MFLLSLFIDASRYYSVGYQAANLRKVSGLARNRGRKCTVGMEMCNGRLVCVLLFMGVSAGKDRFFSMGKLYIGRSDEYLSTQDEVFGRRKEDLCLGEGGSCVVCRQRFRRDDMKNARKACRLWRPAGIPVCRILRNGLSDVEGQKRIPRRNPALLCPSMLPVRVSVRLVA